MTMRDALPSVSSARSSGFSGDPLSDLLARVRLNGTLMFLVDASDPWCVEVPDTESYRAILSPGDRHIISFHVVLEGSGTAIVPDHEPVPFSAGDVVIFPHGDAYRMESGPNAPPEFDAAEMIEFFRALSEGRLPFEVTEGGGGLPRAQFVCGFLACDTAPFNPLISRLPGIFVIRACGIGSDPLARLIEVTLTEFRSRRPGTGNMRLELSELIFVEALRCHLVDGLGGGAGWLSALADPVAGPAITALHDAPSRNWTLDCLARQAGASRSVLAERFRAHIGQPPMQYLTHWRIQLAAQFIADGHTVSETAHAVGFRSDAAFARAFKRVTGTTPGAWRRRERRSEHA